MLAPSLLPLLVAATTGMSSAAARLPYTTTDASELSGRGLAHHEVLRISRDFGKPTYEIVVDSWVPESRPSRISDVRMWWVQNDAHDRRSPFGKKIQRYVDLEYTPQDEDTWGVTLRADRKEFSFVVELGDAGAAEAYADVEVDGRTVAHCRAVDGRLVARRLLGLPIGIKRLEVTCIDDAGATHRGQVPYRKLARGPVYSGD